MSKPAFNISAKDTKTKERVDLFVAWSKDQFEGFDISAPKHKDKGQSKVSIKVEYPDGTKYVVVLDPANKASTHFVNMFAPKPRPAEGADF